MNKFDPTKPVAGCFKNVPMEDYLKLPALSGHGICDFLTSPAHYRARKDNPPEQTAAMKLGTAIHVAILEPMEFLLRYDSAVCGASTKKGAACTNPATGHYPEGYRCGVHAGDTPNPIIMLSAEDKAICESCAESVKQHSEASRLLEGSPRIEVCCVWQDKATGVWMKCRSDIANDGMAIVGDVKTTQGGSFSAADPDSFEYAARKYGYAIQAANNLFGHAKCGSGVFEGFRWIAVQKDAPQAVAVYQLDDGDIQEAQDVIDGVLPRYAECLATDEWPGYPENVTTIKLKKFGNKF